METTKQRTKQQNKALHLYFTHLAEQLNDAGYDMKRTLKEEVAIPWTPENIKEFIWRPIQEAQLGKQSTTELESKEIDLVFNTLNRHLGERFGITVEFPSIETLIAEQRL